MSLKLCFAWLLNQENSELQNKFIVFKAEISLDNKVEGIVKSASRWHTHSALCFPTKAASIQTEPSASVRLAPKHAGLWREGCERLVNIFCEH